MFSNLFIRGILQCSVMGKAKVRKREYEKNNWQYFKHRRIDRRHLFWNSIHEQF